MTDIRKCAQTVVDDYCIYKYVTPKSMNMLEQALAAPVEPVAPVAWINVEKRKLEWNTNFPVRWETPTVVKLDKLPLYATPPSVDALIAEAVAKEREACAQICHSFDSEWSSDVFLRIADAIRAREQK